MQHDIFLLIRIISLFQLLVDCTTDKFHSNVGTKLV